jgi:tetratricopeptide (TPR) repeat protein
VKLKSPSSNQRQQHSDENMRVVYEQAIYYMFENKYNKAAKLFRKIIDAQPNNKAAHIRLQECIEKQPELYNEYNDEDNSKNMEMKGFVSIDDFKEVVHQSYNLNEDINKPQQHGANHGYNNDEIQKMYEEGVYTMFQNNYDEAVKIFHQILRIRPENKAARIRLQECKEAKGNA